VQVCNHAIAENRQTLDGRWDKNDTKDDANVADLVSQGKCQFFESPGEDLQQLRTLLSVYKRLKKQIHRLRMQIRNGLVAKHFPELDRLWGSCLSENLAIVRWCLDPRQIAAMDFEDFVRRVTRRDRGLRQLRTIPGFGPYISAQVLARIGDDQRFKSRKQVIRLAGLDLNAKRSGRRSRQAVPVISKRGNSDLRYTLYQAALIGSYHHAGFRALYNRCLAGREKERGIRTKVRVKLAARMLVIAWTLMRNQNDFDPALLGV